MPPKKVASTKRSGVFKNTADTKKQKTLLNEDNVPTYNWTATRRATFNGMTPTENQRKAIEYEDSLIIEARAGCGKSATLTAYALNKIHKNMWYLSYSNTTISKATDKKKKLPSSSHLEDLSSAPNVTCKTFDSFCGKLAEVGKTQRTPWSLKHMNAMLHDVESFRFMDKNILENIIHKWLISDKTKIEDHIPQDSPLYSKLVLAWDILSHSEPKSFEVIRKLAHIKLSQTPLEEDVLLVDECQDLKLIMIHIIKEYMKWDKKTYNGKLLSKKVVLVGDGNQNIFSYDGTVNAFDHFKDLHKITLDISMRFGGELIPMLNNVLSRVGISKAYAPSTKNTKIEPLSSTIEDNSEQYAYLAYTRASLIKKAKQLVHQKKKFFWKETFGLDRKQDDDHDENPYHLRISHSTNNREQLDLNMIVFLRTENEESTEWKKYHIFDHKKMKECNVILSTVHSCKGLEYNHVILDEDLGVYVSNSYKKNVKGIASEDYLQSINLLHVALTRAKKTIHIPFSIFFDEENDSSIQKHSKAKNPGSFDIKSIPNSPQIPLCKEHKAQYDTIYYQNDTTGKLFQCLLRKNTNQLKSVFNNKISQLTGEVSKQIQNNVNIENIIGAGQSALRRTK